MNLNKFKNPYTTVLSGHFKLMKSAALFFTTLCGLILPLHITAEVSFKDSSDIDTRNRIHKDYIKTLEIRKGENYPSYPIIPLEYDEPLNFSFDDLSGLDEEYMVRALHCTFDWEVSDLQSNEFLNGFSEIPIVQFDNSFNSAIPYVHYEFEFPNDMMTPSISGNYLIQVYPEDLPEEPIFSARVVVYESLIRYRADIKHGSVIAKRNTHQEIDFDVVYNGYSVSRPYDDIENVMLQNMFWDTAIDNLEPVFVKNTEMTYDYGEENNFSGNNEYRFFSTASIGGITPSMHSLQINATTLVPEIELRHDEFRNFRLYTTLPDINGDFKINSILGFDDDTEAGYCEVTFVLNKETPLANRQKIHVLGNFNFNQLTSASQMTYNYKLKRYELTTVLKQGFYNYTYVLSENNELDMTFIEGTHFQTENDYQIITYDTSPIYDYHRVIGLIELNSTVD